MTTVGWYRAKPIAALLFLIAGLLAPQFFSGSGLEIRGWIWMGGTILVGAPIVWQTLTGMFRGQFAADIVASLALVSAVIFWQPFAGLIIALMQTGGEALEQFSARRASRAVAELEAEAPRIAHRTRAGVVEDIPVDAIAVGDRLIVRPGEMVPADGVVRAGRSSLDTARITGEPLPRPAEPNIVVMSGTINLDGPLEIEATAVAAASLYHKIVELVRTAEASKAPIQRMADRAAAWFTPITILACVVAYAASGKAERVLAVLVVATPCPLILAAPVAMLGGINRAARHQIIVRHGGALEQLARVDVAVFDKTGTLTFGEPAVDAVTGIPPYSQDEVLRLAGSIELGSGHLLARTLARAAEEKVGPLPQPTDVVEAAGRGVTGMVDGRRVTVGALTLLKEWEPRAAPALEAAGAGPALRAYVAVDHHPAGTITYADRIRPMAAPTVKALASLGVDRMVLLSGDRAANARAAAAEVGISEAVGDLLPQDKVAFVARLSKTGRRVLMVGDGANDAPALSAATVGLAVAHHGGGISAEAADVVLLSDDLSRIPEAVAIARRTVSITKQSIAVGIGLSSIAMVFAGLGLLVPAIGALIQEAIDVAVIVNALRVMRPGSSEERLHRTLHGA